MNDIQHKTSPADAPIGLAIASLVLGIISIPFGLFLMGGIAGLAGIVLGLIHALRFASRRQMALWGIGLSVVGIILSVRMGLILRRTLQTWQQQAALRWEQWHGVQAPDFSITTLDGQTISLSQLRGKRVVLDFWATWCPPCVKEIPHFIELGKDPQAHDVVIIGISSEAAADLKKFATEHGVNYAIASVQDVDLPAPYNNVRAIPTTFFVDRNGVIQTIFEGYRDYATLRQAALSADYMGEVRSAPAARTEY